jgi:hypothetical protein
MSYTRGRGRGRGQIGRLGPSRNSSRPLSAEEDVSMGSM